MKWQKKNRTANQGVLHVEGVVNDHGSIFRPIHQEDDVGVDGHIELVDAENATGKLVAVQIKSGESYVSASDEQFVVNVSQEHLDYWDSYLIPVMMVCYSPSRNLAAWIPISEYIRYKKYHDRTPITQIKIPFHRVFDAGSLNEGVGGLASAGADRRFLIECVDHCLAGDHRERLQGLQILSDHPDSRDSRTTAFIARRLLFDQNEVVADAAIRTLSYHVGRFRWSWNPNNKDEKQLMAYASQLCSDLTTEECTRLIERLDDEWFGGPQALGERVFDILVRCDESQRVMEDMAADKSLPMQRRVNALYMLYGCDEGELLMDDVLPDSDGYGDVFRTMFPDHVKIDT